MKPIATFMSVSAALLAGITLASAASDLQSRFERLDKDGNGEVTWSEAYMVRTGEFLDMDKNLDGIVEKNEFGGRALPISAFDKDGDGRLQLSEYVGKHHEMFDRFDTDGSGTIDLREFEKAQEAVRKG
jgi:Ca2+-binding EF-hand superfamily protein